MMRSLVLVGTVAVVSVGCGLGDTSESFTFRSPDGDFSVVYPGEPELKSQPIPLLGDDVEITVHVYETSEGAFIVSRVDYAEFGAAPQQLSLEGARDGAVSNVGGTLRDSELVNLSGRQGIEFDFTFADGIGEAIVFTEGLILYQVVAVGESGRGDELVEFVESFAFTEEAGG